MIIYSSTFKPEHESSARLKGIQQSLDRLQPPERDIGFELRAERHGFDGHFADNPNIEDTDRFFAWMEENGLAISSLFIPFAFHQSTQEMGTEVSLVNGWVDLAGYLDIPMIRLRVFAPEALETATFKNSFQQVKQYILDSEIPCAVSVSDASFDLVNSLLQPVSSSQSLLCGMEMILPDEPQTSELQLPCPLEQLAALSFESDGFITIEQAEQLLAWRNAQDLQKIPMVFFER
jgi:hypothetical protein